MQAMNERNKSKLEMNMTQRELQSNINEAKSLSTRTTNGICYVNVALDYNRVKERIQPGLIVGKVCFSIADNIPYKLADIVNVWIETNDDKFYDRMA